MGVFARFTHFGSDGNVLESGQVSLPAYLDWMPIPAKVFWYLQRGYGHPDATHTLLESQGELRLLGVTGTLNHLTLKQLKENENGIEERVDQYIEERGISRTPRNQ